MSNSYRKIILYLSISPSHCLPSPSISSCVCRESDMHCIALQLSVPCKSLISLDTLKGCMAVISFNVPFSNLIGNRSHGFATPPTSPPCWYAPELIQSSVNNWSSSSSSSSLTCFFFFFGLMLEMSLQLQTSRVKSLSSTDSFIRGNRASSTALNLTLLWQKEIAVSGHNSPQHNGWFEVTILSNVINNLFLAPVSM